MSSHDWLARAVLSVALLLLVACAAPLPPGEVLIAPNTPFRLPAPLSLGRSVDAVQLVTAKAMGQTLVFEARVSADREKIFFLGTDPLGRRALTVTRRANTVETEKAAWVPGAIDPAHVLADFMLVYWPSSTIRAGLPAGTELVESTKRRVIVQAGKDLISIDYIKPGWQGTAELTNMAWGYTIAVRSAEVRR